MTHDSRRRADAGGEQPEVDDQRVAELFDEYRNTRARELRNEIAEAFRGLAASIARRYKGRGEPIDDLEQVAMLGLVKAVDRFDPKRGFAFSSFATPTIDGELKRHFRDTTWSVKVPRAIQERRITIRQTVDRLEGRLGRSPLLPEIAQELGTAVDEVVEALAASGAYQTHSLDAPSANDGESGRRYEHHAAHDPTTELERDVLIDEAMDALSDRDRKIVELRFYEDLSQSEIAQRLGISQMHVSRLLRRALEQMRGYVEHS